MQQNTSQSAGSKQVMLHVYENEPTARMAEQRLYSEGVPAMVRSLGGGPGLWGSAFNLPHCLYVFQADETRAREILGLDSADSQDSDGASPQRRSLGLIWILVGIVIAVMIVAPAWTLLSN